MAELDARDLRTVQTVLCFCLDASPPWNSVFTIQGSTMLEKEIRLSANGIGKMAPGADSAEEGIARSSHSDPGVHRRELLITTAMTWVFSVTSARALVVKG